MNNLSTMTDYELVKLYETGKDEAFDVLLSRHQETVYSYIMFLAKDRNLADDIFQDTFARAIVAIRSHKYQATGKFSAWLTRIAHNLIIDHTRDMETNAIIPREEFPLSLTNNIRLSEASLEGKLVEEQNRKTLMNMLDYLPEAQKEVVMMRFFDDMTFKEIALKTNCSINTALGRMRYALINLRKMIQEHELSLVG